MRDVGFDVGAVGVPIYEDVLGTKCRGVLLLKRRPKRDALSGVGMPTPPVLSSRPPTPPVPFSRPSIIDVSSSLKRKIILTVNAKDLKVDIFVTVEFLKLHQVLL